MSWPPESFATDRLRMRKPLAWDAEALFARLCGDADVTRYLGWRTHTQLTQTRQQISYDLLRWDRGAAWTWVMLYQHECESSATPVGMLQLIRQDHSLRLGFLLQSSLWGRGLMREALQSLLADALQQSWVYRVEAACDVDNAASASLLHRLGMRCEGRLARYLVHPNVSSLPRDALLFAMTKD